LIWRMAAHDAPNRLESAKLRNIWFLPAGCIVEKPNLAAHPQM
jgi:hypothetical protein